MGIIVIAQKAILKNYMTAKDAMEQVSIRILIHALHVVDKKSFQKLLIAPHAMGMGQLRIDSEMIRNARNVMGLAKSLIKEHALNAVARVRKRGLAGVAMEQVRLKGRYMIYKGGYFRLYISF